MITVGAGYLTKNAIKTKQIKLKVLNHMLKKKNYFKHPWLYRRKFDWISYDPKTKNEVFNPSMTLVEGHPGTGKSTSIKHQVDRASEIRPALYISFKTNNSNSS